MLLWSTEVNVLAFSMLCFVVSVICAQFSLTQSVREHLQPLNPLVFMKLQTINTVETIIFYQIESWVHWHLFENTYN